jgi:hypothetical protein
VLPAHLVDLIKAVGGVNVAKDLADAFNSLESNPPEVRNSNLYFVLRLKQSSR